jgi:homocysteine S-methyltransferase
MLADGSEYRGDYGLTVAALRTFHRPRLEVLAAAAPDILALETIPCAAEVEALMLEVPDMSLPAWLSLTVSGDRTRNGELLTEVFAMAADVSAIVAVGVNCSTPEDATNAVSLASRSSGKPVVIYPNSGEGWDAAKRRWTGESALGPLQVRRWVEGGAVLVGGCCRVTPSDIAVIARTVNRTRPVQDTNQ